jgi:hypothetical protein
MREFFPTLTVLRVNEFLYMFLWRFQWKSTGLGEWIQTSDMGDSPKTDLPRRSNSKENEMDDCRLPETLENGPLQRGYVNITAMIRSLQRTEGYKDCFRTGLSECDQVNCAWRQYCLQNPEGSPDE